MINGIVIVLFFANLNIYRKKISGMASTLSGKRTFVTILQLANNVFLFGRGKQKKIDRNKRTDLRLFIG